MSVIILNPLPSGATHVGLKRAQRHVKSGRAVWVGDAIRFVESSHKHRAAVKQHDTTRRGYDMVRRILTFKELRHIPIVNVGALR